MRLEDAKMIVTGGAQGIGRHISKRIVEAGGSVAAGDVNEEGLRSLADECKGQKGRLVIRKLDVADEADIASFVDFAAKEMGGLTGLVNNAGILRDGLLVKKDKETGAITKLSKADWQRVIDVNLTGQFLCAREAVREFKRRGVRKEISCAAGKIICMSSVHEVIPWAGHVNYAASKGGVMLMMKSIAQEVAPWRIRVNSIGPGAIRTPINTAAWDNAQAYQSLLKLIPYKRIGEADEIGRAAVWLASDESDYITGTTLFVDGGMTLYPGFETGG